MPSASSSGGAPASTSNTGSPTRTSASSCTPRSSTRASALTIRHILRSSVEPADPRARRPAVVVAAAAKHSVRGSARAIVFPRRLWTLTTMWTSARGVDESARLQRRALAHIVLDRGAASSSSACAAIHSVHRRCR
jgi:hypothetical protein